MDNVLVIARKEFGDLLVNRMVLLVLFAFAVYAISTVYSFSVVLNGHNPNVQVDYQDNVGIAADYTVLYMLSWFCSIIGIIIGCSAISSERMGNALNVLLVKPLYRDTIINGKLLGSFSFLVFVMVFLSAVFTVCFLLLCGGAFTSHLVDYFARLLFVLVYSLVSVGVFLSISMLISLVIDNQAFSMILSMLTVYVSEVMTYPNIAVNVGNVLPGYNLSSLVVGLSPRGILDQVQSVFMDTSTGAVEAFVNILPEFSKLCMYVAVIVVLSYIVFLRKDVS